MLTFFILYLLCGTLIGFLAGLFGIGGGILVIPVLFTLFNMQHMPQALCMHIAISTSLATVIIASASSTFAYYKKGALVLPLVKKCAPGSVFGGLIGVLIASHLHSIYLQRIFGLVLFAVASHLLFSLEPKAKKEMPSKKVFFSAAALFGIIGGMLGLGGGIFLIPFFQWCGFSIRQAAAAAAACILPTAIAGTIVYMVLSLQLPGLPPFSSGFIYWPAFLGISLTSTVFAPLGVRAAHALPTHLLRKLFALFLFLVAIKMF